jgi:hypothetical protein
MRGRTRVAARMQMTTNRLRLPHPPSPDQRSCQNPPAPSPRVQQRQTQNGWHRQQQHQQPQQQEQLLKLLHPRPLFVLPPLLRLRPPPQRPTVWLGVLRRPRWPVPSSAPVAHLVAGPPTPPPAVRR